MSKSISFKGEPLEYEMRGGGLPVMLLHGFMEDRRIWYPMLEGLDEKYRWILPDLPGSGSSAHNRNLPQIKDFTEVLRAIADAENIREMVLIGHSMGGYISLAYAEKYPESLRALGLFHSSSHSDSAEKKESRDKNIRFIEANGARAFIEMSLPGLYSDGFKETNPEEILKQIERYANFKPESLVQYLSAMKQRPATTELLRSFNKPILFIMGEEDKAVPIKDSLEQCHIPPISFIHMLGGTAHMGMIEKTSVCKNDIDQFLEQFHF
jgi:pimeloyl-ACP methyl ester carboxylesterase